MQLKLVSVLLVWACVHVFAEGYSQKVTLSERNASLEKVFREIKKQSGIIFWYESSLLKKAGKVDIQVREVPVQTALDLLLKDLPLTYSIIEKTIVINAKERTAPEKQLTPISSAPVPGEMSLPTLRTPYIFLSTRELPVSQNIVIRGKVIDEKGEGLPGVNILIKGSQQGTVTNEDGDFIMDVPDEKTVLVFSFVGYLPEEVAVGNRTTVNVALKPDNKSLDEVVVVGYGTQKRKDFTGAVSHVKGEQMQNESATTVQDFLIGNVPGLNVPLNATPKGGGDLLIRGKSSLTAGTSPLLVVDGIIYYGNLIDINPNDIESIDVLKDASSAAVFGAKAANGVVLITTKKGTSSKPTISFKSDVGIATMGVHQRPNSPDEFITWRQNAMENIFVNHRPYQFSDPRNLPSDISIAQWLAYTGSTDDPVNEWLRRLNFQNEQIKNYLAGKTVNWYDEVFKNGPRQDYTISLSGKTEGVSYFMSLEYLNNKGIIVGDGFHTLRGRLNLEGKVSKFMTAGINLQLTNRDESSVPANWPRMATNSPFGSKYNEDGTLRWSPDSDAGGLITAQARNPFLEPEYTDRYRIIKTLFSSIYLKGTLPFGFSYQINFTPNYNFNKNFNAYSSKNRDYATIGGTASRNYDETYNWQIDNIIKWNKTFKDIHHFDVTLLANAEKFQSWGSTISSSGFQPNDDLGYHSVGSGTNFSVSSSDEYGTGDALMARLNYTLKDRYLVTMSVRRDGYSAFGQKNPRAIFHALGLGWVLSEEAFMTSYDWLNYAKLRFSYGINGNRDIGRYQALSDLSTGKYLYASPNGSAYQVSELFVNRMSNPNLSWEKTTAYNIGMDFTVLNNRLDGSVDLYKKSTSDLLVLRSLPNITGFSNVMGIVKHI